MLLKAPASFQGVGDPNEVATSKKGDVYLNTTTGTWYQKIIGWEPMGVLTHNFNKILWGHVYPETIASSNVENDVYVYSDPKNPLYFYVYRFKNGAWQMEHKVRGPGLVPSTPSIINTSGFKQLERASWMLYSGVICVAVGAAGTAFSFFKK